jgi:hypothetical protein
VLTTDVSGLRLAKLPARLQIEVMRHFHGRQGEIEEDINDDCAAFVMLRVKQAASAGVSGD